MVAWLAGGDTRPAKTRLRKGGPMSRLSGVRWVLGVACVLASVAAVGGAEPAESPEARQARETFNTLFGRDVARVKGTPAHEDNVVLAKRLVEVAGEATDSPEFLTILCEHAYRLGAGHPTGYGTATRAMELLAEHVPARAEDARSRIERLGSGGPADAGDTKASTGPGGADDTGSAPQSELDVLLAEIDRKQQAGDLIEAAALYRKAAALARRTDQDRLPAIEKASDELARRIRLLRRARDVTAMLQNDPDNVSAREGLVRLYLVELDDPKQAAEVVEGVADEDLKRYVPAAARPVAEAPELACLQLGKWYAGLAETAPKDARAAMHIRAKTYLDRFLTLHETKDLDQVRAKVLDEKVTRALTALGVDPAALAVAKTAEPPEPSPPLEPTTPAEPAEAPVPAEPGPPWKHVFAFGTNRSFLLAGGKPCLEEPFCRRTVELWFRVPAGNGTMYEEGGFVNGQALAIRKNRLRYVVVQKKVSYTLEGPLPEAGTWCHAAGQFDRGTLSLWVNGRLCIEKAGADPMIPHHERGAIGAGEKGSPLCEGESAPGIASRVAVFRASAIARYTERFRPDPLLKPDPATLYYLSASAVSKGPVKAGGIPDQTPLLAKTVWEPHGPVKVVPLEANARMSVPLAPAEPADEAVPEEAIVRPGQQVNLLALVDPDRDTVLGVWQRAGMALATGDAGDFKGSAKIGFPLRIAGGYRLSLCFTTWRNVGLVLPVADTAVYLNLGGGNGKKCGLAMVDGKHFEQNETFVERAIEPDVEHTLDVAVRLDGNLVALNVHLDGLPLTSWSGRPSLLALNPGWRMARTDCVGFGCKADKPTTLKRMDLELLSGEARVLRPSPGAALAITETKASGTPQTVPTQTPPDKPKPDGVPGSAPKKTAPPQGPPKTPTEEPAEDLSADALHRQLLEAAAEGNLSDDLLDLFRDVTAARVREQYVPDRIPDTLWTWIVGHPVFRDAVVLGLYPENDRDLRILERLAALRQEFPDEVDTYPHLAMAFAMVYGTAGTKPVRERRLGWVAEGRTIPSMAESFGDYVKHASTATMPLTRTPWPLLVLVADNDLPLAEREWVRGEYGSKITRSVAQIYYDLEYDNDKRRGNAKIGDRPHTMANLLSFGGVCADRAYFASRVAKTFGIPAMYDVGAGERGGHAWLAYVGHGRRNVDLAFSGRFDYDRYYTGTVYHPTYADVVLDRDVQLDVAAMAHSYQGYLEAVAACRIYSMIEEGRRGEVTGLLEGAVKRNPYCAVPWRLVAVEVAEGRIARTLGERMYQSMLRQFAEYPDLTFQVLARILKPRLAEAADADQREVSDNLGILGKAHAVYAKANRPDLAVKLRCLQGEYLEAAGRTQDAMKLYVAASEQYLAEHFGFVELFDRACRLMKASGQDRIMLKYMGRVASAVPAFKTSENQEFREVNPTYQRVVKTYAGALRAAGRTTEADQELEQLQQTIGKKE